MRCPLEQHQQKDLLLDYCAGRLEAGAAALLERHSEGCAACREFVAAQSQVWQALDGWDAPPLSPAFGRHLSERIAREGDDWWTRAARLLTRRPALVLASACAMVVLALWLQPSPTVGSRQDAWDETAEIEQVESALEDLDMLRELDQAAGVEPVAARPI